MTGFELQTSGDGSDRSSSTATTTAHKHTDISIWNTYKCYTI